MDLNFKEWKNIDFYLCGAMILFMFVIFVGFDPFPYARLKASDIEETGTGNIVRQLIFIVIALSFANAVKSKKEHIFRMFSISIVVVLIWCALTLLWSNAQFIAGRRFILLLIMMFTIFAMIVHFGPNISLKIFAYILFSFILISDLSCLVIPGAVHNANDFGADDLIGNWRGLFNHKNTAGATAAMFIIIAVYMFQRYRERIWLLGIFSAVVLLIFSASKTSMGLLVPSLLAGFSLQLFAVSKSARKIYLSLLILLLLTIILVAYSYSSVIDHIMADPAAFTGRTQIWQALGYAINDRYLFGWGYESLWYVNVATPMLRYADGWVLIVTHGHNGYLDMWASTGLIGLVLALLAFIFLPAKEVILNSKIPAAKSSMIISMIVFISLHNFMESSLMSAADARWVTLLFLIGVVKSYRFEPALINQGLKPKVATKLAKRR